MKKQIANIITLCRILGSIGLLFCPVFSACFYGLYIFCGLTDVVLIVMWTMAAKEDISYLSVIICFVMFLVNDLYGFISWKRMEKRQMAAA